MPSTPAKQPTATASPSPFDDRGFDYNLLPDHDNDFINEEDIQEFAKALYGSADWSGATSPSPATDNVDRTNQPSGTPSSLFITALNDWRPVYQRVRRGGSGAGAPPAHASSKRKKRRAQQRGKDETREGFVYSLLKWPLLCIVLGWIVVLGAAYTLTRWYIYLYENLVTMRGRRDVLRKRLRQTVTYEEWVEVAEEMDAYLGNDKWKEEDEYAYYNSTTVRKVRDELRRLRTALDGGQLSRGDGDEKRQVAEDLRALVEAAVKDNFVGVENSHLYSETYYGTKNLVQSFIDEVTLSLEALERSQMLDDTQKAALSKHLQRNYGRTALCLSGGATFAYYHFGVAKALLDEGVLPQVITGTSGGALVAGLLATRTDEELEKTLVPALAHRITACSEPFTVWFPRWWRTGARFDSLNWARACCWICRGSLTFREAYERTGRILNVTCIPSDPHSPTVLANYLTAPDCVIWSAVLASAAVPGILNPVVLMRKTRDGTLAPYSFGHKWKDGSLRTDIPLKALNTHFNVNFSIVSQVNPHINLFFFSSRGTVGRPVTHRRGRGWRGGFLGSATEQYLKLDLTKWLKVLRHLELLPRPMGQDWSEVWLQRFSGTITIWPRSVPSDFLHILSDPPPGRLARMIHVGQQSAFPKLKFIRNRMAVERRIEELGGADLPAPNAAVAAEQLATESGGAPRNRDGAERLAAVLSEEDLQALLAQARKRNGAVKPTLDVPAADALRATTPPEEPKGGALLRWWSRPSSSSGTLVNGEASPTPESKRRSAVMTEIERQSRVFFDDDFEDDDTEVEGDADAGEGESLYESAEEG